VTEPPTDCARCPRLAEFRRVNREAKPDWHNAPVSAFGGCDAALLIVGLAPGVSGANRTGRPFTGDFAGDLLYRILAAHGFTRGQYDRSADDGLTLARCRITNAVRCVPPQNRPTATEINTCRSFLRYEIESLPNLRVILALGTIAHRSVVTALDARQAVYPFAHGALHSPPGGFTLADSYHCSRYNTNTGRITVEMFDAVVARVRELIDGD
jgi:uracil-DNA glycosylase family 4